MAIDNLKRLLKRASAGMSAVMILSFSGVVAAETAEEKAYRLAAASLEAMGGAEAYDKTRYLSWVFFGRRFHIWDKHTGNIRIEYEDNKVVLMNIHSKEGRAWENGVEVTDPEKLAERMDWGYKVWINDSYWLVMPYKLRDPGVNLAYTRDDKMANGNEAYVLTMTFNDVGVTPENKYEVFINKKTMLVSEFAYYAKAENDKPDFNRPWENWAKQHGIMLSDKRGELSMAPVMVHKGLPASVFESPKATVGIKGAFIQ
jgi:hypothetical protein